MIEPKSQKDGALQRSMIMFGILEKMFRVNGHDGLADGCETHKDLCGAVLPNKYRPTREEWESLMENSTAEGGDHGNE